MSVLDAAVRLMLVLVLGVAALSKLRYRTALTQFRGSLSPVFGAAAGILAVGAVALELVAAVALCVPVFATAGLVLAALLMTAYVVGIALGLRRGQRLTCRCFGGSGATLGRAELIRNLVLGVLAGGTAWLGPALPAASGPQLLVAATVGALAALAVVRWDDLMFLLPPAERIPA